MPLLSPILNFPVEVTLSTYMMNSNDNSSQPYFGGCFKWMCPSLDE